MSQENNNERRVTTYWLSLDRFYGKKSTMEVNLIDADSKVGINITPSINPEGNQGRPQAGVKAFDYERTVRFTLTNREVQAIVTAAKEGILFNNQISFIHQYNGNSNTFRIGVYNNGPLTVSILTNNGNVSHYLTPTNFNNGITINSEFEYFISLLESVLKNTVIIRGGLLKEYTPKYNNNGGNNGNSNYSNNSFNNSGNSYRPNNGSNNGYTPNNSYNSQQANQRSNNGYGNQQQNSGYSGNSGSGNPSFDNPDDTLGF